MDFSGEKAATVDEKGRVVLPAEFKQEMGGRVPDSQLVVEEDPYVKCLNIYPLEIWNKHISTILEKLNPNNRNHSRLLDMIYKRFKKVAVPDSCRIHIPGIFAEKMNIGKEVMFVGRGDRIRLWGREEYEKYLTETDSGYGDLYEELLGPTDQ